LHIVIKYIQLAWCFVWLNMW